MEEDLIRIMQTGGVFRRFRKFLLVFNTDRFTKNGDKVIDLMLDPSESSLLVGSKMGNSCKSFFLSYSFSDPLCRHY